MPPHTLIYQRKEEGGPLQIDKEFVHCAATDPVLYAISVFFVFENFCFHFPEKKKSRPSGEIFVYNIQYKTLFSLIFGRQINDFVDHGIFISSPNESSQTSGSTFGYGMGHGGIGPPARKTYTQNSGFGFFGPKALFLDGSKRCGSFWYDQELLGWLGGRVCIAFVFFVFAEPYKK